MCSQLSECHHRLTADFQVQAWLGVYMSAAVQYSHAREPATIEAAVLSHSDPAQSGAGMCCCAALWVCAHSARAVLNA